MRYVNALIALMTIREGAREYYEKGRNQEKLIKCYYMLEDYTALETSVANLTDKHPLLSTIGSMFASVGMCSQAVSAYIKVKLNCHGLFNGWRRKLKRKSYHVWKES